MQPVEVAARLFRPTIYMEFFMSSVIEHLIRHLEPKSCSFEASGSNGGRKASFISGEIFAALNLAASKHPHGLLVIKARYTGDETAQEILLGIIHRKAVAMKMDYPDIIAIVVMAMIFDRPLLTQKKHIKSIYMKHGSKAKQTEININAIEKKLSELNVYNSDTAYLESMYYGQIDAARVALERYAEMKSTETNRCPRCVGFIGSGCQTCGGNGKISVRMADVTAFFNNQGLTYAKHQFLTKFWVKIVTLVSEFQVKENEAEAAMQKRIAAEYRT